MPLLIALLLASSLALIPAADPGLVKWPLVAFFAALAVWGCSRPSKFVVMDMAVGLYFLYSIAHSHYYHDQWAVDLATCIGGLSYLLVRWAVAPVPGWAIMGFVWIIGLRGVWDVLFGSIWAMGTPYMMISYFVNKNMFAYLLTPLLWFSWAKFRPLGKGWARRAWFATLVFVFIVLMSSQSRGALMGFCASLLAVGALGAVQSKNLRPAIVSFSALGLVLLSNFLLFSAMRENIRELGTGLHQEQTRLPLNFHHTSSSEGRSWIWQAALDSWKKHPVLGNGTGSTQYRIIQFQKPWLHDERSPYKTAWHAHSHYLEVLQDKGAAGLALELAILAMALWGRAKGNGSAIFGFGALVALSVHNLVAEASEYPASILLFWGLVGGGIRLWAQSRKGFEQPIASRAVVVAIPVVSIVFALLAVRPVLADLRVGQALRETNELRKLDLFGQALSWWPDNPDALDALAVNQAQNNDAQSAFATLDHVDSVAPGLKYTPVLRAQILFKAGRVREAESMARTALVQYPYYRPLQDVLLASLQGQGKCAEYQLASGAFVDQINRLFLPRLALDSAAFARDGNRIPRSKMLLPRWAPESSFEGYEAINTPHLGREKLDLLSRREALVRASCEVKPGSDLPVAAPSSPPAPARPRT